MSSSIPEGMLEAFESAAQLYTGAKVTQTIIATSFCYYAALHFDLEVEYIWKKKWSIGKVMYILTRYSGAFFIVYAIAIEHQELWAQTFSNEEYPGSPGFPIGKIKSEYHECLNGNLYDGFGSMIMLVAEVILQMRVYALYGRKRWMLVLFTLLTLGMLALNITQTKGIPQAAANRICVGCITERAFVREVPTDYFCVIEAAKMSAIGWLLTSLVELFLYLMVLWKARQIKSLNPHINTISISQKLNQMHDITAVMARHSTTYFAIIFSISFIGTALSALIEIEIPIASTAYSQFWDDISCYMNVYQTIVVATMAILAPKLLVDLRVEYYGPVGQLTENSDLTWNAAVRGHVVDSEVSDLRTSATESQIY